MPPSAKMPPAAKIDIFLLLAVTWFTFGTSYLAIKVAIQTLPPLLLAGTNFTIAGMLLLFWGARKEQVTLVQIRALFSSSLFLYLGGRGFLVLGEQRLSSGITALIAATVPFFVTLFGAIFFRQPLSWQRILGIVLGAGGVILLLIPNQRAYMVVSRPDFLGTTLLLLSSSSWAFGSLCSTRISSTLSPFTKTGGQMMIGGPILCLVGIVKGELSTWHWEQTSFSSLLASVYICLIVVLFGYVAYSRLLNEASPEVANTFSYVSPVIAIFLGSVVLHETVLPKTIAATVIIGVSVVLLLLSNSRPLSNPETL